MKRNNILKTDSSRNFIKRAYYSNTISSFLKDNSSKIIGELSIKHDFSVDELQKNAWIKQTELLKKAFHGHSDGYIYFEFSIPRMGKRVDNIIIIDDLIFVVEFKIGDTRYRQHDIDQVIDYSLDLINFHEASHNAKIIPVLVATEATSVENKLKLSTGNLYSTQFSNRINIYTTISNCFSEKGQNPINPIKWESSLYKPTPTIIEAAKALYKGHKVSEISRSDAGAINLSDTSDCIDKIIEYSKTHNKKSICFITGVPGAGKTLAGLNIANERQKSDLDVHAVFLSGNGPLVNVIRKALTDDEYQRLKGLGNKIKKNDIERKVNSFIQNIHHFRDNYLESNDIPTEKVVIFDEAQRAWTKEQASAFMKRKRGKEDFGISEPDFLISVMDRHKEWCTIVCLVGGGQEINIGEAGLEEWVDSIKKHYGKWDVYFSESIILNNNYISSPEIIDWLKKRGTKKTELHLSTSIRSFRSEKISNLVQELLDLNIENSKEILTSIGSRYPIVLTRNLRVAKSWLKYKSRGTERIGIVASSGERRLRAVGIDVKNEIDPSEWFLKEKEDVRSSYFLEQTATEFDIQGLEIDWVCVAWGANFYFDGEKWQYQSFKGNRWMNIHKEINKKYLKNAYRVLLTRARQGMVIYIPHGSKKDQTRINKYYDQTFSLLKKIGISEI